MILNITFLMIGSILIGMHIDDAVRSRKISASNLLGILYAFLPIIIAISALLRKM